MVRGTWAVENRGRPCGNAQHVYLTGARNEVRRFWCHCTRIHRRDERVRCLGAADFQAGAEPQDAYRLRFRLTIASPDIAAFLSDPAHPARADGYIQCERLGGRLFVERGSFNLFVDASAGQRRMLYCLHFRALLQHAVREIRPRRVNLDFRLRRRPEFGWRCPPSALGCVGTHRVGRVFPQNAVDMPISRDDVPVVEVTTVVGSERVKREARTLGQITLIRGAMDEAERDCQARQMGHVFFLPLRIDQMSHPRHQRQMVE